MEISKISGLWSNIKKYDKILTIFHLQHFFKNRSVFSEHVQSLDNIVPEGPCCVFYAGF